MQPERILFYRLHWSVQAKLGNVVLVTGGVTDQTETTLENLTAPEFQTLVMVLRHERPLYFDPATATVFSGNEIVGEEEID